MSFRRRDRIRTCDFYVPNVALYQAEPHAADKYINTGWEKFQLIFEINSSIWYYKTVVMICDNGRVQRMFNRQSIHIAMLLWGSIFGVIAAVCMIMSRNFNRRKRTIIISIQITTAVLLLMDAVAWATRGYPGKAGYYLVRISNFCVFTASDCILALFNAYVCGYLFEEKKASKSAKIRFNAVYVLAAVGVVLDIVTQFTGLYYYFDALNFYHRSPYNFVSMLIPVAGMLVDLSIIIQYRRNVSAQIIAAMLSYIVLPFAMTIIQTFYYGISLINISISISMIFMFIVSMVEQNRNLARKEKEASELKISLMLSQIAPHFIYNTLTAIQQMCVKDPQMAQETVGEFAEYLRGNIDILGKNELIPFKKELEHTKNYLSIEKKRFGDRVKTEYIIETDDFMLPALTLQPIVENAVKHGVCRKSGGGTVTIHTYSDEDNVFIEVSDDGAGFDMNMEKSDGREHVGIKNVQTRLEEQCHGKLLVSSRPGDGTVAIITIPKEK